MAAVLSFPLGGLRCEATSTTTTSKRLQCLISASAARNAFLHQSLGVSASKLLSVRIRGARKPFICRSSIGGAAGLTPELKEALDAYVKSNNVVLFMKGTKLFPQCGFSNTVVQILNSLNVPYETVNILENEGVRSGMKLYSNWPTFPQLYIGGEFFGGCDITLEAYKNGELQETIEKALCS